MSCDSSVELQTKNTVIGLNFSDLYVSSIFVLTKNVKSMKASFQHGDKTIFESDSIKIEPGKREINYGFSKTCIKNTVKDKKIDSCKILIVSEEPKGYISCIMVRGSET